MHPDTHFFPSILSNVYSSETTCNEKYDHHSLVVVFGMSVKLSWYPMLVLDVTVMRVLLFMLHECMLRECEGARVTEMLVWGMDDVR